MLSGLATAYLTAAASPGTAWLTATAPLPPPGMGIPIPSGRQAFASVTFGPLGEHQVYLPMTCMNDAPGALPCEDVIENGGFEYDGVWEIPETDWPAAYATKRAHSGNRSMRIGIANPANNVFSYSSARQEVTIDVDADSARLRFWLYTMVVGGTESGSEALPPPPAVGQTLQSLVLDSDAQYVLVLDGDDIIGTLLWQRRNDRAWTFHEFDLMDYVGQTIQLHFGVFNNGAGGVTAMYLDDVSLEICPEEPPPEPPDCYPWLEAEVGVGETPHGVAFNSDANRIYVANHDENTLSAINGVTYGIVDTSPAGVGPNGVAYNPNNDRIYIAIGAKDKVQVRRADNLNLVKGILVGSQPLGMAVNPDTNRVYVSNYADGTVSIINGATNTVIETVDVGVEPAMIAVNPETNKAYVALHGMGQVAAIDGAGDASLVDVFSEGPYGITVDTVRNLVYVATIDTFRIVVVDGSDDSFEGWAEIRRTPSGEPVPLRMIAVNPSIGGSGHVFLTTVGEDGGWNKFLLLHKGWPDYFSRPIAMDLSEAREGMAFDPVHSRVFVTSRSSDLLAVYLDGEPTCPYNFSDEYQLTICVANPNGTCREVITR
jgi:YVTN family beta-propeller protein